jgi:hypothetical protein
MMQDMNDTLAEIRRRGETRIRERKRIRNRAMALCVPLVLCVAAVLAMPEVSRPTYVANPVETLVPTVTQPFTNPGFQNQQYFTEEEPVMISVSGKNGSRSYTDGETLAKVQKLLDACKVSVQGTAIATDATAVGAPYQNKDTGDAIRLTLLDGENPREYLLYEATLYDLQEDLAYPISKATYNSLLWALGLDQP